MDLTDATELLRQFRQVFGRPKSAVPALRPPTIQSGAALSRKVVAQSERVMGSNEMVRALDGACYPDGTTRGTITTLFAMVPHKSDMRKGMEFRDTSCFLEANVVLLGRSAVEQIVSHERFETISDMLLDDPIQHQVDDEDDENAHDEEQEEEEDCDGKKRKRKRKRKLSVPVEARLRRMLVGFVPFLWNCAVYEFKVQQTYSMKHKWQDVAKSCLVHPPWHDMNKLRQFVKQCVRFTVGMTPELLIDQEKQIDKNMRRVQNRATKDGESAVDALRTWVEATPNISALIDARCHQTERYWSVYPCMNETYHRYRMFDGNRWWDTLKDATKSLWEAQLLQVDTAFAMCFRELMPRELQLTHTCHQMDAQHLDNRLLVLEYKLDQAQERQPIRKEEVVRLQLAIAQTRLQRALLLVRVAVEAEEATTPGNDGDDKFSMVPELDLRGFQSLCSFHQWMLSANVPVVVSAPAGDANITPHQKKHTPRQSVCIPRVVPELQDRLLALDARTWMTEMFAQDHHCCLAEALVPTKHERGINYLVRIGAVVREQINGSTFLLLRYWYDAKVAFARVIVQMEQYGLVVPQPVWQLDRLRNPPLTQDQQQFLDLVYKHPITCLMGSFGSGKTEMIALLDQVAPVGSMHVMAFTGDAVDNVGERIVCERSTMHAFKQQAEIRSKQLSVSHLDKARTVVCVDEMSMTTELLLMETLAMTTTHRLVLVGDPQQIPSFGLFRGNVFRELLRICPTWTCVKNYRQERDPSNLIIPNAERVSRGNHKLMFDGKSFYVRQEYESGKNEIMERAVQTHFDNFQWITPLREHAAELNHECVLRLRDLEAKEYLATLDANVHVDVPSPHTIDWRRQRPEAICNTFWPGGRIVFSGLVQRSPDDVVDAQLNQLFYVRSAQTSAHTDRTLFHNGGRDEIESIHTVSLATGEISAQTLPFATRSAYRFATAFSQPFQYAAQQQPELGPAGRPLPEWVQTRRRTRLLTKQQNAADGAIVLKLRRSGIYVRLSDAFKHGYAVTPNKMQGREVDEAVLALRTLGSVLKAPPSKRLSRAERYLRDVFGREHFYTSIGRARKVFGMVGIGYAEIKHLVSHASPTSMSHLSHFVVTQRAAIEAARSSDLS